MANERDPFWRDGKCVVCESVMEEEGQHCDDCPGGALLDEVAGVRTREAINAARLAAAVEVAEAVTEAEAARIAYRNGGGFQKHRAWDQALARQEEALHRYRTAKEADARH